MSDLPVNQHLDPALFPDKREGYVIDVDSDGVRLYASTPAGMFYARQTLEQLTVRRGSHTVTPQVHIKDWPRYRWRGIHLDVARHYFDSATLEKFIDVAARYKLNVVHLHFTDNESWRLPSTRFPKLPSMRHYSVGDITRLVHFAAQRYVTIVPEIDLPAHSGAAIRAYPSLACGSPDTLCPARAIPFANAAIGELAAMFPQGTPIHVGGDEVAGWSTPQRRQFFAPLSRSGGAPRIVWDDEADVAPPSTIVMVWHLGNAAAQAAAAGHEVVMAQDGPLYFNAAQGDPKQEPPASRYMTTLEQVYAYDLDVPKVAGIEATLWTEKIATPEQLWYMLLPRQMALAEIAWTKPQRKSWPGFRAALPAQFDWLARHGYAYRIANVSIEATSQLARYGSVKGEPNSARLAASFPVTLKLQGAINGAALRYRINGGSWLRYGAPIVVNKPARVDARQTAAGRSSAITTLYVRGRSEPLASRSFDAVVSP
jgi:hexosaminidase